MGIKENFSYPLDERWNVQEITDVVDFFTKIEGPPIYFRTNAKTLCGWTKNGAA